MLVYVVRFHRSYKLAVPNQKLTRPDGLFLSGCFYLNGFLAVFMAQFLLLGGLLFSVATVGDCSLVETGSRNFFPPQVFLDLPAGRNFTTTLGLIFFAKPNGECYWYDLGDSPENQINWYITELTPDWNVSRGFAALGVVLGLLVFIYTLSLVCTAQKRGMRSFMAFLVSVALSCFQALTFLVFPTDFCDDVECSVSRTTTFCTVSVCMYFCGGLCFLFTSNYPGDLLLAEEKMRTQPQQPIMATVLPAEPLRPSEEQNPKMASDQNSNEQTNNLDPEIEVICSEAIDEENAPTIAVIDEAGVTTEVSNGAVAKNDTVQQNMTPVEVSDNDLEIATTNMKNRSDPPEE